MGEKKGRKEALPNMSLILGTRASVSIVDRSSEVL